MDKRLSKLSLKTSLCCILDLVLPRVCIVCDRKLLPCEKHLCLCCLADLPMTYYWAMRSNPMADKFNAKLCLDQYEPYAYAAALFFYDADSGYSLITQALKYRGDVPAGRYFARLLGSKLAESELFRDVDLVVPVPLHRSRRWKRGYNQAEIIAKEIAASLGARLCSHLLRRTRRTTTQTLLSGSDKDKNVEGAFGIDLKTLRRLGLGSGSGMELESESGLGVIADNGSIRHILLVDDVFTSGATMASCYKALRKFLSASTRISVATLAYVAVI